MTGEVLDLDIDYPQDGMAREISNKFVSWETLRGKWAAERRELRDYLFATDTSTTSNAHLPWKNKTTIPKLTQIRDNLHANYMAALFSTDDWLRWEGDSEEDQAKANLIQEYMKNKLRQRNFETLVSQLVLDYIDNGNVFVSAYYTNETYQTEEGELVTEYSGPQAMRISPFDIVFNPAAISFEHSPKIIRSIKTMGDLLADIESNPGEGWKQEAVSDMTTLRKTIASIAQTDHFKGHAYQIDGFSDIRHYYDSGYVELLEFHGDLYDVNEEKLYRNHIITVADRTKIVRIQPNPSWTGKSRIKHAGWRLRPDNLYAMGPLDNLVGMQYRIDHLENLKADAADMIAFPMTKIKGEVEDFEYGPGERIYVDEEGDVEFLHPPTEFLLADSQIAILEQKMEEFAGAPKQAMGIRTPGEKTKFEVQALENAAGRVFQNKIQYFEENVLLPLLNDMLAEARRNMDATDTIRVIDDEFGVTLFEKISKEDLASKGKLRPVGARHFAAKANLVQTLTQLTQSPMWQDRAVSNHFSGLKLAKIVEEALELDKFELVQENIRIAEEMATQQMINAGTQQLEEEEVAGTIAAQEGTLPI